MAAEKDIILSNCIEKKLLLIGLGNIGRRVAALANGIGMEIMAYDPYLNLQLKPDYVTMYTDLKQAVSEADVISLHVPGLESNRHLINDEMLRLMKPSAFLVNTSRGTLIDETALYNALKEHRILGAGLDVFEEEPIAAGNPLMTLENVIASPHHAANSKEAHERAEIECAENILSCFRGEKPKYALNDIANNQYR